MGKASNFWGEYTECLRHEGIPEGKIRWYLRWAEGFSRSVKGVPLKERSIEDVTRFLDDLKADEGTVPWQVEQARSALGILYRKHLGLDPAEMPAKRAGAAQDSVSQPRQLEALHGELLDQVRTLIRVKHFSGRTEEAYLSWIRRFIAFHDLRSPLELNESHIHAYLGYLATEKAVASSTQNQALNALVFLYAKVLKVDLGDFSDFVRARAPKRVPASLARGEVAALLEVLEMPHLLMAMLMYGTGMRVTECLQLRVCDLDFERALIQVRGKGAKERRVMLPAACVAFINERLSGVRQIYDQDRLHDSGLSWPDYYLFPSPDLKIDPVTRAVARGHMTRVGIYHALGEGARKAGIPQKVTPHMLRHAFAEHMIEDGVHILTVQELLGHARLSTTMIYTHPMNRGGPRPESPLSGLGEHPA